jgi:hypothetical protein
VVAFFCLFVSLVSPFAGFLASGIKRGYDIKDFATSLPGHGGFLDRFDCAILVASFTYLLLASGLLFKDQLDIERAEYLIQDLSEYEKQVVVNALS